jgi:hypothetical protein
MHLLGVTESGIQLHEDNTCMQATGSLRSAVAAAAAVLLCTLAAMAHRRRLQRPNTGVSAIAA